MPSTMPRDPIEGNSTFTKTFPERGPRDKKGRSLRDFDLQTRLFRYPLSYMIYSAAFEGMPAMASVPTRKVQRVTGNFLERPPISQMFCS